MRTGRHGPRAWGLALTLAVHALLWLVFAFGLAKPRPPQARPGNVMTVALLNKPPAPPAALAESAASEAPEAAPPVPELSSEPVREEVHYYFPEELERQLIVLRDRSGEAEIDLQGDVVMNLFVDVEGHVVAITFEGEAPSPALQEQLRQAFMTMEFMPGVRQGQPVPSRIKINIAPANSLRAPERAPVY